MSRPNFKLSLLDSKSNFGAVLTQRGKANADTFCLANFLEKLLIQLLIPNTSGKTMDIYLH